MATTAEIVVDALQKFLVHLDNRYEEKGQAQQGGTVLSSDLTVGYKVGGISPNTVYPAGTDIKTILIDMLKIPDYFYDIFIHKVGADSTGYFDTGVQVNTEYTFEVTCKVEPGLMGNIIWGGTGSTFRTGFHIFTSSNKIQYYWGNINNTSPTLSTTSSIDFTKEFTVKQNKNGIIISQEGKDDVNYTYSYTGEQTTAESNIELLHYPVTLNANIKYGALKRVKIWDENNELIRDFRTVKRTVDGVVYLHDEVHDLVYSPVVTDDTDGGLEEYVQ